MLRYAPLLESDQAQTLGEYDEGGTDDDHRRQGEHDTHADDEAELAEPLEVGEQQREKGDGGGHRRRRQSAARLAYRLDERRFRTQASPSGLAVAGEDVDAEVDAETEEDGEEFVTVQKQYIDDLDSAINGERPMTADEQEISDELGEIFG